MNPLKIFWKKGKKGYLQKFLPNLPKIVKISIFRKTSIYCTLFTLFYPFDKKWVRRPIFYVHPIFKPKSIHQKPKKYHFLKFWKNDPKWSYCETKMFTHVYLFFWLDQFGWYLWARRSKHISFRLRKFFLKKG